MWQELDGLWIAAMLAADASLQLGRVLRPLAAAPFELAHAHLVEGGEGILLEDACLEVRGQDC